MKFDGFYGRVDVTVGTEFRIGPGRWRVEAILTKNKFRSRLDDQTKVPAIVCRRVEGQTDPAIEHKIQMGMFGLFSGDSVATQVYEERLAWRAASERTDDWIDALPDNVSVTRALGAAPSDDDGFAF